MAPSWLRPCAKVHTCTWHALEWATWGTQLAVEQQAATVASLKLFTHCQSLYCTLGGDRGMWVGVGGEVGGEDEAEEREWVGIWEGMGRR